METTTPKSQLHTLPSVSNGGGAEDVCCLLFSQTDRNKIITTISLEVFGEAFPCYDLQRASWNRQISAEKCLEAAAVAQAECCFPPPSMAPSSSTGTAAPISSNSAPGVGQDPPTAAPNTNSSTASATVPLCSSMMFVTGVLLLFSIIG